MNRAVTLIFALLCAAGVGFGILQNVRMRERDGEVEGYRRDLKAARDAVAAAEKSAAEARASAAAAAENIERLKRERDEARQLAKAAPATGAPPSQVGAAGDADSMRAGAMSEFAKIFESEEGRKMMRSQMGMVTRMQYGDLARSLKLRPETAEQLMELIADKQAAMSQGAMKMMGGGMPDAEALEKVEEWTKTLNDEYDAKLKAVLGEQGFAQFQDYEKSIGDRMMMQQYDQQFNAAGVPLAAEQREKLLAIMQDERKKSPELIFDTTGRDPLKGMAAMQDAAAVEKWLAQEEDYQRRVLAAAPGALSPDQVAALQKSFTQSLEMQKFGIKMGAEMMKGQKKGDAALPAPVVIPAQ